MLKRPLQRQRSLWLSDNNGSQIVEWVSFAAVLVTLAAIIYAVLNDPVQNAPLRSGVRSVMFGYAERFGLDMRAGPYEMPDIEADVPTMGDEEMTLLLYEDVPLNGQAFQEEQLTAQQLQAINDQRAWNTVANQGRDLNGQELQAANDQRAWDTVANQGRDLNGQELQAANDQRAWDTVGNQGRDLNAQELQAANQQRANDQRALDGVATQGQQVQQQQINNAAVGLSNQQQALNGAAGPQGGMQANGLLPSALRGAWSGAVAVNLQSGAYTLYQHSSLRRTFVRPAPGVLAKVDVASGTITLVDPQRGLRVVLDPRTGLASTTDPTTGVGMTLDLDRLAALRLVTIQADPGSLQGQSLVSMIMAIPRLWM